MGLLRRIFFCTFSVIYLIFCPLIILYALGITFKPQTKTIIKTGIIHINTAPSGASVYINNRKFSEKTPTTIRNLPPGDYSLKLALNNYQPWEKTISVAEEKNTNIDHVILIPTVWDTRTIAETPFENLIPVLGKPFLLLNTQMALKDLFVYRIEEGLGKTLLEDFKPGDQPATEKLQPLFKTDFLHREGRIRRYFTMNNSPFLLLEVDLSEKYKYLWADLRPEEIIVHDITDLFPAVPDDVKWDPKDPHILLAMQDKSINRLDIESMAIYPKITSDTVGFALFDKKIYILTKNHILKRLDADGKNPHVLLGKSQLNSKLLGEQDQWKIYVLDQEIIILINQEGSLLFNQPPYFLVDQDVKNFVFDENLQRLLIWTNSKIGVIDFVPKNTKPSDLKTPQLTWLVNNAQEIDQAFWVNKGSHILYKDAGRIFLVEAFDPSEQSSPYEITEVKKQSAIAYFDTTGTIFYLNRKTERLSSLTILPSSEGSIFPQFKKDQTTQAGQNAF